MLSFVATALDLGKSGRVESKAKTARQRAHDEIAAEILLAARTRLTSEGPNNLALRAVARDVGMVSSAVYRYFASRDELLTALLVEGYNELGSAIEEADTSVRERTDVFERWMRACRAIRSWARAHPGDYALLYGSPVPGYAAPQDTITPASRVIIVLVSIVVDAHAAGARPPAVPTVAGPRVGDVIENALAFIRDQGLTDELAPAEVAMRTMMAWTTIFGTVSFELFGHLVGSVEDYGAYFDHVVVRLAGDLGFVPVAAG
jgi:AcrR family transcriptional regulator